MVTKTEIVELLKTNDKAVARALVVLNSRQEIDEQRSETTKYLNGRGFRPCHARMGTSMARWFLAKGFLSPKQINYWRRPMKDGKMRIEIYAGQLLDAAAIKARVQADLNERAMQAMEAAGDRAGTARDEVNKAFTRSVMEAA